MLWVVAGQGWKIPHDWWDSNPRPSDLQTDRLTTMIRGPVFLWPAVWHANLHATRAIVLWPAVWRANHYATRANVLWPAVWRANHYAARAIVLWPAVWHANHHAMRASVPVTCSLRCQPLCCMGQCSVTCSLRCQPLCYEGQCSWYHSCYQISFLLCIDCTQIVICQFWRLINIMGNQFQQRSEKNRLVVDAWSVWSH